jgi:hypothetical protein
MTRLMIVAAISLCLVGQTAQAASNLALSSYFEQKILLGENSMRSYDPAGSVNLVDYNLQFVAQVGFGLSDVVSLVLYPEIDLVFVPSEPEPRITSK